MSGIEPVLEVDLRLSDHVVRAHEVPVEDLHRQHRVLGEGGLDLETPSGRGEAGLVGVWVLGGSSEVSKGGFLVRSVGYEAVGVRLYVISETCFQIVFEIVVRCKVS